MQKLENSSTIELTSGHIAVQINFIKNAEEYYRQISICQELIFFRIILQNAFWNITMYLLIILNPFYYQTIR